MNFNDSKADSGSLRGAEVRLEAFRRNPPQSGMRAHGVVEGLQIGKNVCVRGRARVILLQVDEFTFQTAEEVLRDSVVVGIALSGHTLLNSQLFQTEAKSSGSILYASVAVEDQPCARTLPGYCHIQGIQSKLCVDPVGESVSYYFFGT